VRRCRRCSSAAPTSTVVSSAGLLVVSSGGIASLTTVSSGGFVTVSSGGVASATLTVSSGGATVSGTVVTEDTTPCYCPGTLILTPDGEVPVEELKIGDRVVTLSGEARPIEWIGRRSYAGQFVLGRDDILPVCITAGALGEGIPRRDLWVSPNHALYLGGVLIEAKDLVH
jgi:autotransporter passenger strand-loop-strand repeat protein